MLNFTRFSIFLFIACLVLFTCGLSQHELTQFETRFGYFAQEIGRHGFSFFPLLYGKPYPDYPATYAILIYFSSLIFGKVTLFSAVWPSAINAAATVVLTYRLGALQKISWGMAAVLFEVGTFYFLMTARSLSLDQFVLFATTLSFYLVYLDQIEGTTHYRKWLPWVFIYGFIFRGPMGIVLPLSVVVIFDLLNADYRKLIKTIFIGILLFLLANVVMLWMAYLEGGKDFIVQVMGMQGLSRIKDLGHYPFYYYFEQALTNYALAFPIAVIVVAVLHRAIFNKHPKPDMKFMQYLVGWAGILLLGLSIPTEKKLRYILPITPAISLLGARIIVENSSWFLAQIRSMLLSLCFIFPLIGLLLVGLTFGFGMYKHMELGGHYLVAAIFLVAIFFIGWHSMRFWTEKTLRYNIKLAMGVGAFLVLTIFMVQPIHAYFNRTNPFAEQVDHYYLPGKKIVFYKIGPDGEDIKLMVALNRPELPSFVKSEAQLLNVTPQDIIIGRAHDYDQLPDAMKKHFLVLYRGKIGHQKAVLFRFSQ